MLLRIGLLLLTVFALAALAASGLKLYLTDGTDQVVREYKVLEDRIRYYSLERGAWEEIPLELVDLERTRAEEQKEEARLAVRRREEAVEIAAERRARTELHRVPLEDGIYYVREAEIVPVEAHDVLLNGSKKRTLLRIISPLPAVTNKTFVELEGASSPFVVHQEKPVFYVRLEKIAWLGIVRLTEKDERRRVQVIESLPQVPDKFEQQEEVEVFRQQLAPQVYRIWPIQPLPPGEYAVIEYTPNEGDIRVWDFRYAPPPAGE